jgi:glutathione synthase
MRIGFFINDIMAESPGYTTTRLAQTALSLGHEAWYISAADFALDPDDHVYARARSAPRSNYKTGEPFLRDLQSSRAVQERIRVDDLDILMLRSNPADDTGSRSWAQQAGIIFGRLAVRRGVVVVNDPDGLGRALNKMYFQHFPEEVRPLSLITRSNDEIKRFARDRGTVVLKPLQGSGGTNVFMVRPEDLPNVNQMIDAILRDGYVIAQEYLPAATEGDVRMFLMNGEPLRYKGRYAAYRRRRSGGDLRSNIHAGGSSAPAVVDSTMLELAEMVRPKLVQDGMFLVGLDIVGDKLMEINVFSPGGLGSAQKFEGVPFTRGVINALERKVRYMSFYRRNFDNADLAVL